MDDVEIPWKQQQILKRLLRNFRHIKTMIISTSQDATMQNLKFNRHLYTTRALFGGIPMDRLKNTIWPELPVRMDFDDFYKIYRNATEPVIIDGKKTNPALIIDKRTPIPTFQQGFTHIYEVPVWKTLFPISYFLPYTTYYIEKGKWIRILEIGNSVL